MVRDLRAEHFLTIQFSWCARKNYYVAIICSADLWCREISFGFARTTNVVVQKMRSCRHKVKRMLSVDADEETALD